MITNSNTLAYERCVYISSTCDTQTEFTSHDDEAHRDRSLGHVVAPSTHNRVR